MEVWTVTQGIGTSGCGRHWPMAHRPSMLLYCWYHNDALLCNRVLRCLAKGPHFPPPMQLDVTKETDDEDHVGVLWFGS